MEHEGFRIQIGLDCRMVTQEKNKLARPLRVNFSGGVVHLGKQMHVEFHAGGMGHAGDGFGFSWIENHAWARAYFIAAGDMNRDVLWDILGAIGVDPLGQK